MKTMEEFVDEMKRSEALQDEVRAIFAEFLLSEEETDEEEPEDTKRSCDQTNEMKVASDGEKR